MSGSRAEDDPAAADTATALLARLHRMQERYRWLRHGTPLALFAGMILLVPLPAWVRHASLLAPTVGFGLLALSLALLNYGPRPALRQLSRFVALSAAAATMLLLLLVLRAHSVGFIVWQRWMPPAIACTGLAALLVFIGVLSAHHLDARIRDLQAQLPPPPPAEPDDFEGRDLQKWDQAS
ncbi:MAG: hypothetical protein ACREJ2_00340 [Planctomycetota bacterium]